MASSQPLANAAGVQVLERGGTAADAAVATAAALQVTQPCSTGLGGDAFWLYHCADDGKLYAANGSGRSPAALTLETAQGVAAAEAGAGADADAGEEPRRLPPFHAHTVTVPGAPAAWQTLLERFGSLARAEVLSPAVALARDGFPVAPLTAGWWTEGARRQLAGRRHGHELIPAGAAADSPAAAGSVETGERIRIPTLAWSLSQFAAHGAEPFYRGEIAERIVAAVRDEGGVLSMSDLASHQTEMVEAIGLSYHGATVWECPPNGQGLAALVALGVLREFEAASAHPAGLGAPSPHADEYHAMIEAMRIGFTAAEAYIADPAAAEIPVPELLSPSELAGRARLIEPKHRLSTLPSPAPGALGTPGADTVYFCCADRFGNVCSFINSNFMGFGTGIVPRGCGFSLQNRGHGFVLDEQHPNALEPGKRPYHTIIPGMITHDSGAVTAFGVMGGMMQPQGHLQTVVALLRDRFDPQTALDRARFQLADGRPEGELLLEDAAGHDVVRDLTEKGHRVRTVGGSARSVFGLGAIVHREPNGTLWGASDPRGDGAAAAAL